MRGIAFSRLLMFVVLVPLAGLAIFGGKLAYDSWSRYSDLSRAASVLKLALATAKFVGVAIPGEGAMSRETIAGKNDPATLQARRKTTDDLYRGVVEAGAALSVRTGRLDAQLKALDERMRAILAFRPQLDAKVFKSPNDSTLVIAPAAQTGIDLLASTVGAVDDPLLARTILALYTTIQFNENTMIQRGAGEMALREGKLPPPPFAIFARAVALNAAFGRLFHELGWAPIVAQYDAFEQANGRDIEELRRFALANAGTPATEAQVNRWLEISRDITAVMGKVLSGTFEAVDADGERMLSDARFDMLVYLGLTFGVLAVVVVLSRKVLGVLRDLLGELAGAMDKMRDGNYAVEIPHVQRTDEIGTMARATEGFRENFVRVQAQENERKNADATAERKTLMGKLAGEFEAAIGKIVGAVSSASGELTATATTLTATADTTQQLTSTVATASEEASSNVQSVASATEEMSSSIAEIGRQVQESSQIATEAVSQAAKTDDRITKLAQAANRIGDVTQLITSIAEQTNLLALNATIEAARAGEAGKGFAVVAQEVKQLASQTAKATSEISTQISEMQAATQESVGAIKEIGTTIGRISEIATTIASAVEQQGAATQEITRNIQRAAAGTGQVAGSISEVSAGAAKTGTASAQVLAEAKSLAEQSGRLTSEVEKFLRTIRAA
jgi:methyl-accepting chemotaxis protein